ncbi:E3 ubiquitin-protein ligase RNF10 isoform X2 [Parasteatoda tepidariorum]|uniref:E3 ubiquitin-protein ligase RNF10 isoform X2 n=1 Tax=Parasteatoda tepidariorum TaxID=114398 RepID=UPI001C725F42|nr:RING finger protein 10-like isoform X2 [Parasteatoda tepidariorum]
MAGQKEVFSVIERERAAYEMDTPVACFMESAFTGNVPERKHLISTSSTESYEELHETEDGQHICIHNINVKMLLKEYGSLEFAPETITTKLVEVERVAMTEVSNPLVLNFLLLKLFR